MRKVLLVPLVAVALFQFAPRVFTQARGAAPARPAPTTWPVSPNPALDWPTFGGSVARTSGSAAPTRIDASNVGTLVRQQVTVDGIVDASVIYLHGAQVAGAAHDVFFATTRFGVTMAIDATSGAT